MYNSILVPVDPSYSERAEAMLDAVARLRTEASKVILLAVIEDIPSFIAMEVPEGTLERSRGEALQILQRIAGSAPFPKKIIGTSYSRRARRRALLLERVMWRRRNAEWSGARAVPTSATTASDYSNSMLTLPQTRPAERSLRTAR